MSRAVLYARVSTLDWATVPGAQGRPPQTTMAVAMIYPEVEKGGRDANWHFESHSADNSYYTV